MAYNVVKFILWLVFRLGFGLQVSGQEHVPTSGPFILASNHLSYLDPPVLGAACPRSLRFMARADLFKHVALRVFFYLVNVMPLQRGEGDVRAIREAVARLRRGEAMAIFPEGGRQFSGRLGAAKRGVGLLAEMAQAPIVPALVQGTFEALPPHGRRMRRAKIRVAFGPPISYTDSSAPAARGRVGPQAGGAHDIPARVRHEQLAQTLTDRWRWLQAQLQPVRSPTEREAGRANP